MFNGLLEIDWRVKLGEELAAMGNDGEGVDDETNGRIPMGATGALL